MSISSTPWTSQNIGDSLHLGMPHIYSADGKIVAQTFGDNKEEREANALLIAAAPDLLEACETALSEGDEHVAIKKLKAAIAKATSPSAQ